MKISLLLLAMFLAVSANGQDVVNQTQGLQENLTAAEPIVSGQIVKEDSQQLAVLTTLSDSTGAIGVAVSTAKTGDQVAIATSGRTSVSVDGACNIQDFVTFVGSFGHCQSSAPTTQIIGTAASTVGTQGGSIFVHLGGISSNSSGSGSLGFTPAHQDLSVGTTGANVASLFSGCSSVLYLGADAACHALYFQTVQQSGVALTQRAVLNFLSPMVVSDNPSNTSIDVTCGNCLNQNNNAQGANQLISGGQVEWTGNYNFTVGAATYTISGMNYSSPLTNITLAAADPTNDRIDVIAVDNTNAVSVLQGTPANPPLEPTVDPTTQLELTFVYVTANTTAPAQITRADIYHSNTEWTTVRSANTNPPWNLASTNNPYDTTVDVEATTAGLNAFVSFTDPASATVDLGTVNNLVFYIRSKATWNVNRSLTLRWYNGATAKGQAVVLRNGTFGFNTSITTAYQQIAIPTTLFGISGIPVTTLRMTVSGTGATTIGFYLDDITLQGGAGTITLPNGILVYAGAWSATSSYSVNSVVTYNGSTYVAILPGTNNTPSPTSTFWTALSTGFNPATTTLFDDFLSGNTLSALGWAANGGGGAVTPNPTATNQQAANHPGIMEVQGGGSNNNWEYLILSSQNTKLLDPTANKFTITSTFLPAQTIVATPGGTMRFGVFDVTSMNQQNPNSAVYFESVAGGAWNCVVNNAGTPVAVSSGVSPATGTWQTFSITFSGATTGETWAINGTTVCGTQSQAMTSTANSSIGYEAVNTGSVQGAELIDYFSLTWNLTRR